MKVKLSTNLGDVVLQLDSEKAPTTVANFVDYVREGFYDGTLFHRVIPGFVVQGGGFTPGMHQKSTRGAIKNEADNGLKNLRGTVAMARTPNPHSASSQFFINLSDNAFLDHTARSDDGWGYCVFGEVVEGLDVVDRVATAKTTRRGGHQDVPQEDVVVERAEVLEPA